MEKTAPAEIDIRKENTFKVLRVLFVSAGRENGNVSPIIKAQGDSLSERGVHISYFPITGRGLKGYFKSIFILRKFLMKSRYDIIHAHYSLSGWVALLASGKTPVVLSLMGDDIQGTYTSADKIKFSSLLLIASTKIIQPFVSAIISKSPNLAKNVDRKSISYTIPNGVKLYDFPEEGFRDELGLKKDIKYVLFIGDINDPNKNFNLVKSALSLLNRTDVELISIYNRPHSEVFKYLCSVDVFTLCSYGEGSPNVIKEAMACNCPLVSTPAGDVQWITGDTEGCYMASHDIPDFADKLNSALEFSDTHGRTKGRERIISLSLDSATVAERIIKIYHFVLTNKF
jgi:teichuronic acid biosynthesis glycosyltransferase TuaC